MIICPLCGSPEHVVLGQLGRRIHLRCRSCGIVHNVDQEHEGDQ